MRSRTKSTAAVTAVILTAGAGSPLSQDRRTPRNRRRRTPATGSSSLCGLIPITAARTAAGVGQVVAGGTGHPVPAEISGSLADAAVNQTLFTFDQAKGGGNATHNQPTLTCTVSETSVLGDSLKRWGHTAARHLGQRSGDVQPHGDSRSAFLSLEFLGLMVIPATRPLNSDFIECRSASLVVLSTNGGPHADRTGR